LIGKAITVRSVVRDHVEEIFICFVASPKNRSDLASPFDPHLSCYATSMVRQCQRWSLLQLSKSVWDCPSQTGMWTTARSNVGSRLFPLPGPPCNVKLPQVCRFEDCLICSTPCFFLCAVRFHQYIFVVFSHFQRFRIFQLRSLHDPVVLELFLSNMRNCLRKLSLCSVVVARRFFISSWLAVLP